MAFTRKRTTIGSKLAGPKPVVLPSEKKENAGQDPNVSLVPHKRGVWGSLTTGPRPDDHGSHEAEAPHDGGQAGTLPAHAPSSGGPAWGGAGLPERIQEQAKDGAADEENGDTGNRSDRLHGDPRHAHGHLRQWDDYGGQQMHESHMRPPPPPPPHASGRRSDSEHQPYPPRAPPPPGPPPPGPPSHHAPRGGPHGPPDYQPSGPQSGMPPHAPPHSRMHPRREGPDSVKRHPGFSPEGNFTAKLEAMSGRGGGHAPSDSHHHRRGPAEPRSGGPAGRHGPHTRGATPGSQGSTQPSSRDPEKAGDEAASAAQSEPQQARSASASSQDAAAALATAAAAAAAAALQRPPLARPAAAAPVASATPAPAQPQGVSGPPVVSEPATAPESAPVHAGPVKPVQMGTPVMHLVQGQPIPHGMQPVPPGVTVVPLMPGVQQQTTSHVMASGMHPATMPVTMHMGPGGMMPVISSHGQPVPGAVYQHMPMAHPHAPHQVPPQAMMHPQVMLVQHPGGVPLQSGVRPQHAVMGPALPQGPHSVMPQQHEAPVAVSGPPPAAVPSGAAAPSQRDGRGAPGAPPAPVNSVHSAAPPVPGHPAAAPPVAGSVHAQAAVEQQAGPARQPESERSGAIVSKWSRPPNATPRSRQPDEKQQKERAPPVPDAETQPSEHLGKKRGIRREEQTKGQGRGQASAGRSGRKPDGDAEAANSQQRSDRGGRGRGRRDRVQAADSVLEPAVHAGRGSGQSADQSVEGEHADAGRGRGRGRGWGRGAGRGTGRGSRWEPSAGERPQGGSEAVNLSDDAKGQSDTLGGRYTRQPGRGGRGRRSGNVRENGRGQEAADRDEVSRGERSVADGVSALPQADSKGHDARNGAASKAVGSGRGRRNLDGSRSQGRASGRHNEGTQPRRRDGGDSAVNVESAAAAAQAAAAAASASAEIAPQVFTQALAKIEAFKIPELPQASAKASESKSKDVNRASKGRRTRAKTTVSVDGNATGPK